MDILGEAVALKKAQLKGRAGRQAWETAPDFFKCTAYNDDSISTLRSSPIPERVAAALLLKDQGNKTHEQDPQGALELYTRAIGLFTWFDRPKDRSAEDLPLVDSLVTASDADKEQADQVLSACFTNAALCLFKQQRFEDVIFACNKALQHDPYSTKALFRRAEAHYNLQGGTSTGLEAAVKDLKEALQLEPNNARVRAMLAKRQAELLEQNRKDREVFGNMFNRSDGPLYEDEEICDTSNPLDKKESAPPKLDDTEVARTFQGVKKNLAQARLREEERRQLRLLRGNSSTGIAATFAHVPWWGWVLIGLHLIYRIIKLCSMPKVKSAQHGDASFSPDEL